MESDKILNSNLNIIDRKYFFDNYLFENIKPFIADSKIIINEKARKNLKNILQKHKQAKLIYKRSRDGFNGVKFDKKCENMFPSFVLIKSKEHQ
jgi:hypothetical protein